MFNAPSLPAKRKLNFDSPKESELEINTPWIVDGVNLEEQVAKLCEELRDTGKNIPSAVPDPNSPLRTEYRKMKNAILIVSEGTNHVENKIQWMNHALAISTQDEEQLNKRKTIIDENIKNLRKQIDNMNASISRKTQLAVETVVEMYGDDFENNDCDYEKFTEISKLCKVALDSFKRIIIETTQLENEVVKLNRHLKAIKKVCDSTKSHPAKYDKLITHLTSNHNLAQLQSILSKTKM